MCCVVRSFVRSFVGKTFIDKSIGITWILNVALTMFCSELDSSCRNAFLSDIFLIISACVNSGIRTLLKIFGAFFRSGMMKKACFDA